MILAWMLFATFVSAALGLAALALDRAARAVGRPTRHAWTAALLLSALVPLARLVPRDAAAPGSQGMTVMPALVIDAGREAVQSVASWTPLAERVALAAWGLASALLLLRLGLGVHAVRRARGAWKPCEIDGVAVLVTPATGPAVVGVRRPAIVLPEWMLSLDPALRALVLRHEMEHVRAGDAGLRLLSALLTALVPWNVALWWQHRRLALAVEVDCDARVLRADERRERYGLLLLTIAQRQTVAMLAPALSEPTSHLERRITIMQHSKPRHPALVASGLAAAAALALAVACTTPAPDATVAPPTAVSVGPITIPNPSGPAPKATAAASSGAPMMEFQVTKRAEFASGNRVPRHPDSLTTTKRSGEVLAQVVVERDGSVLPGSFKVLKASDPSFAEAVKAVIYDWKFTPAEVDGHVVRQLVQMPFMFTDKP